MDIIDHIDRIKQSHSNGSKYFNRNVKTGWKTKQLQVNKSQVQTLNDYSEKPQKSPQFALLKD